MKLSDELVCDARQIATEAERSIAGQIEFWAQLGRSIEPLLRGDHALALKRSGSARSLSEAIATADSEAGRNRVAEFLDQRPYPHFEPVPDSPGLLRCISEDGSIQTGRFVNRVFVPDS